MPPPILRTQVAIIGGGPVGLALAAELGGRGIRCVVVEPDPRTRLVPRAKLANVRTMEHARRWGIADEVRAASTLPASFTTDVAFVTTLDGKELTRFTNVFFTRPDRDDRFAEPAQQIAQFQLEPVLRRFADSHSSTTMLDGHCLVGLRQTSAGVEAMIEGVAHGSERVLQADYLVGCDGARSTVRRLLDIPVGGTRAIARNFSVIFRAPALRDRIAHPPALHYWIANPELPSFMGPLDTSDHWWLQATAIDPGVALDRIEPRTLVRTSIGLEIDLEVLTTDPWEAHALLAERLFAGRCFLAGDAAHVHTPMGAHGMNAGIGDAIDLGWKLAAVLDGWAPRALLTTYEQERTPLHVRVLDEATTNYASLPNHFAEPGLEGEGPAPEARRREVAASIQAAKTREFSSLGLVLGHGYERSPAIVPDGSAPPAEDVVAFDPFVRPGRRVPHVWMRDGRSLFDLLSSGFTLLRVDDGVDVRSIRDAAAERGVPLTVVDVEEPGVREAYPSALTLIRPDQHVAWHADAAPEDPSWLLDVVTGAHATTERYAGDASPRRTSARA